MKKLIILNTMIALIYINNSFGMCRTLRTSQAHRVKATSRFLQRRKYHSEEMITKEEITPLMNGLLQSNQAARKVITRNEHVIKALQHQTSLCQEAIKYNVQTLDNIAHALATNQNSFEGNDTSPLHKDITKIEDIIFKSSLLKTE